MPLDKLSKIIKVLEEGETRRIDGTHINDITKQRYLYKAYVISNPQNLIRIDIKKIKGGK